MDCHTASPFLPLPDGLVIASLLATESQLVVHVADRKSTRLNSSHSQISYAVFCLKKKNNSHEHIFIVNLTRPCIMYMTVAFSASARVYSDGFCRLILQALPTDRSAYTILLPMTHI